MVVGKPITKYCCSDTTQTEARVIALFSIFTTLFCLMALFLTFSQVKGEFFQSSKLIGVPKISGNDNQTEGNKNPNCFRATGRFLDEFNKTLELEALENSNNVTTVSVTAIPETNFSTTEKPKNVTEITIENSDGLKNENEMTRAPLDTELYMLRLKWQRQLAQNGTILPDIKSINLAATLDGRVICSTANKSKTNENIRKSQRSQLDLMAEFLLWDVDTDVNWILPPFIWNICDLIRGLLLLTALRKRNAALAKLWWSLTAMTCLILIILFVPILLTLSSGEFVTIFSLLVILVLSYNFYGMWIVNALVVDITSVSTIEYYNNGYVCDQVKQINVTPIEKFGVRFRDEINDCHL